MSTLVPILNRQLDAIADATTAAVENYPGDPLDVAHVLLCAAVETMVQRGLDDDLIRRLASVIIDNGRL